MSSLTISFAVFACVLGGALVGVFLRATLPREHLSPESRDVIKLATGIIATMTAVLMGLLVASAKGYYDSQSLEVTEASARIVVLDRVLAHYGPDAKKARNALRASVAAALDRVWGNDASSHPRQELTGAVEGVYDNIQELSPQNDTQRSLQSRAVNLTFDLGQTRVLMAEQASTSISKPLLLVVVFSLSITFASFCLHASPNLTVIVTLILCALAVAGTLFLILEMYSPFQGLIQIPSDPLRNALAQVGR
jgi:hypothetical protein